MRFAILLDGFEVKGCAEVDVVAGWMVGGCEM